MSNPDMRPWVLCLFAACFCLVTARSAKACLCFPTPICSEPPDGSGKRIAFVGTVSNIGPEPPDYRVNLSLAEYKVELIRRWMQILSKEERHRVELAQTDEQLRQATDLKLYTLQVRFEVKEPLETIAGPVVDIFTEATSCGFRFSQGKEYLVVGQRSDRSRRWLTGACSGSAEAQSEDAANNLIALRAWHARRKLAPMVYGRLNDSAIPHASAFRVRLRGRTHTIEKQLDSDGRFRFDNLRTGRYRIELVGAGLQGKPELLDLHRSACFEANPFISGGGGASAPARYSLSISPLIMRPD